MLRKFVSSSGLKCVTVNLSKTKKFPQFSAYSSRLISESKVHSRNIHTRKVNSTNNNIRVVRSPFADITLQNVTIDELLLNNVVRWPDKVAVQCAVTGKKYTYSELRTLSCRFAASLKKEGFQPGNVLCISLPNIPDYAIVFLGALKAGLIISPTNPIYTPHELAHQLEDNKATAIVTTSDVASKLDEVKNIIEQRTNTAYSIRKILLKLTVDEKLPSGSLNFAEMISDNVTSSETSATCAPSDVAILSYSSGTTGLPKAVQLTHSNIVSNILQTQDHETGFLISTTKNYQEVLVAFLPFFHAYGFAVILFRSIFHGCKLITMPKFDLSLLARVLEYHRITVLHAVPPTILLLGSSDIITISHLSSVNYIICGGAPHESADNEAVIAKSQKEIGFCQIYGATETGPLTFVTPISAKNFTYLVPLTLTQTKIIKSDGSSASANEEGEICVKGPQVMKGYLNKPQETMEVFDDEGFYHTGDIGKFNEDGIFSITDRVKELIKVKGFQVAPAELEYILRSHPCVADAAVVGIPDQRSGEKPFAFVIKNKAPEMNEEDLMNFVAKRVAPYKRLGGVRFVDSIPKSLSGKILRRVLKEEFRRK